MTNLQFFTVKKSHDFKLRVHEGEDLQLQLERLGKFQAVLQVLLMHKKMTVMGVHIFDGLYDEYQTRYADMVKEVFDQTPSFDELLAHCPDPSNQNAFASMLQCGSR